MDVSDGRQEFSRNPTLEDLIQLCKSLNGAAVRATGDIDLLVDPSTENIERIRKALSYLPDKAVLEVKPNDVRDYTVVRVADEIVIDLLGKACEVTFDQLKDIDLAYIREVAIPFAGIRALIETKKSIRPKDQIDRAFLEEKLKKSK